MKLNKLREELLQNPEFREEYYKDDIALDVAEMFIDARIRTGLTQKELAGRIDTKQPGIARIERGNYVPSLRFLEKAAVAFGARFIPPKFSFLGEKTTINTGVTDVMSNLKVSQLTVNFASSNELSGHVAITGVAHNYGTDNIISASQNHDEPSLVPAV